mmetsp:Transcript_27152/g.65235  ORF Transcript_27152/g.65235 Transcript_27152/m.65235 type:complete len:333 (-) Transcript_27152:220-1218(-)
MVEQNLVLCLLFATLDGLFEILAIAVLMYHDKKSETDGDESETDGDEAISPCARYAGMGANLLFQGLSTISATVAPWFGPVSIFVPTALCSELLLNMVIIGFIMKKEELNKDTQVATYIMLLAALLLPVVGPIPQDDQTNPLTLLEKPFSLAWIGLFVVLFIGSTALMIMKRYERMGQFRGEMCILVVAIGAEVLSPTVSRAFGTMESGGAVRIALIGFYIMIQLVWTYQGIVEARYVSSHVKYVPLSTCGALIFNALTGLLVWEDWKAITSWLGYAYTFMIMLFGVYLMSDLKFFEVKEKRTRSSMAMFIDTVDTTMLVRSTGSRHLDVEN